MPTGHVPSCTKHHPVNLNQGEGIFTEHHTRQWHYFTPITRGQVHPSLTIQKRTINSRTCLKASLHFLQKATPQLHTHDNSTPFHSRGARKIGTLPDPCPKNGVQSQIIRSQPGSHRMASHQASPFYFFLHPTLPTGIGSTAPAFQLPLFTLSHDIGKAMWEAQKHPDAREACVQVSTILRVLLVYPSPISATSVAAACPPIPCPPILFSVHHSFVHQFFFLSTISFARPFS